MSEFIEYVILFALIGSLESLLTAKAIDNLDPYQRKSDFNKDLRAVGIGNTLAGLLGGLPMISEVARSSANVSNGAKTRWANFFHGVFLLLAVLLFVPIIEMIPNAALASMLIFVGFRLAHPREFKHVWHVGKEQFVIFTTTVVVTLATDLLVGVGSGILLELIINIFNSSTKDLFACNLDVKQDENNYTIKVNSGLMFSNILGFKKQLAAIPLDKHVHIDLSTAPIVDHTSMVTLRALVEDFKRGGGSFKMDGIHEHRHLGHDQNSTRLLK